MFHSAPHTLQAGMIRRQILDDNDVGALQASNSHAPQVIDCLMILFHG